MNPFPTITSSLSQKRVAEATSHAVMYLTHHYLINVGALELYVFMHSLHIC
jgi:hypothetical protein